MKTKVCRTTFFDSGPTWPNASRTISISRSPRSAVNSAVCCTASLKQVRFLREKNPDARATVFYIDIRAVEWDHVAELVEDSYRAIAPKTLAKQLDA